MGGFLEFSCNVLDWNVSSASEANICLYYSLNEKNLTTPTFAGVKLFGRCISLGLKEHNPV
jgi:hypothetical protein